jgi:hypothetical protein
MSKIREALAEPMKSRIVCKYCLWLLSLEEEDRQAVVESYASSLTTTEMVKRLALFGMPVTHHPVAEHRAGKHSEVL